MDISQSSLRKYISKFRPELRESIARVICNGEAFINAVDSPNVKILLDVITEGVVKEIEQLINLIRDGKYENEEELRRIRQHCIGINKIDEIIRNWEVKLNTLDRHLRDMNEG